MRWPAEREERLRQLWDEGHSTAEIGRRMGLSKNAVVDRAHRLKLPPRPSPIIRGPNQKPRRIRAPTQTLPVLPTVVLPQQQFGDGGRWFDTGSAGNRGPIRGATLAVPGIPVVPAETPRPRRVSGGTCQFILNDARPWRFCDAEALPGKSYCASCYGRVFVVRPRADEAEAA